MIHEFYNGKHKNKIVSKIDTVMFYLCIIDIMFLPYIRVLSASISMILIPIWFLFNCKKIKVTKEFKVFILFLVCVFVSLLFSFINYPEYIKTNISGFVVLTYGFLYYFFFKFYFSNSTVPIKTILITYVTFGLMLSTIYYLNPILYFKIRSIWTMSGDIIEVKSSLLIHRFTSTFGDPNNTATIFVAILTFFAFNVKHREVEMIYVLLATVFIIFNTMSSAGFILLSITLSLLVIKAIKGISFKTTIKTSKLIMIMLIIFSSPLLGYVGIKFLNSDVATLALYRFTQNSTDSRIEIWWKLLINNNIMKYIVFGMGGTILVNGFSFKPHNGHLHLIYNYGMIAYTAFMFIFFRPRKIKYFQKYLFLIPLFLGFTINVGIQEPRFINILALLVAAYASKIDELCYLETSS